MSTLGDLLQERTPLRGGDIDWLHLLVAEWQLLADLSFADLLLWVPTTPAADDFVVAAQMRPTTGPTVHEHDLVGTLATDRARELLQRAWSREAICREGEPDWATGVPVREEMIPVRHGTHLVGVVERDTNVAAARMPSHLELAYLRSAGDLSVMVSEGRFPFEGAGPDPETSPRVGDGFLRLDAGGRVVYASPNALSAYRRLGVSGDLVGADLGAVTSALVPAEGPLEEPRVTSVLLSRTPQEYEVESGGAVVRLRAIPLVPAGELLGAIVLLRDVTEVRRRDRQLLSKDATIREIHHRVKNNLQTVAALLRLQARRISAPEARAALEESVRRVTSIAVVHETLAVSLEETVDFDGIADTLIAMVADVAAPETTVRMRRAGSFGVVRGDAAAPLSMVLTELLQNAVEHAFGPGGGAVELRVERGDGELTVVVADDGCGLPADFAPEASSRLGLQIVRTLVTTELGGSLAFRAGAPGGAEVEVRVPLR